MGSMPLLTYLSDGLYTCDMNLIQQMLAQLKEKRWTNVAIADELEVHHITIRRWQTGDRYPENAKPVAMALDVLIARKSVPKQRRYPGTHYLQRAKAERERQDEMG